MSPHNASSGLAWSVFPWWQRNGARRFRQKIPHVNRKQSVNKRIVWTNESIVMASYRWTTIRKFFKAYESKSSRGKQDIRKWKTHERKCSTEKKKLRAEKTRTDSLILERVSVSLIKELQATNSGAFQWPQRERGGNEGTLSTPQTTSAQDQLLGSHFSVHLIAIGSNYWSLKWPELESRTFFERGLLQDLWMSKGIEPALLLDRHRLTD